ncbi:hypothetical protein [Streptomyces sp. NPDC001380]|uniref:hypothetical protein n=1 Tax=Streptomyces sp. NPDC001380 TaxID=3364566 RepID=UPI0036B02A7D
MADIPADRAVPSADLLVPDTPVVLFVDRRPRMSVGAGSGDRAALTNGMIGSAKGAKLPDVPAVLTRAATGF